MYKYEIFPFSICANLIKKIGTLSITPQFELYPLCTPGWSKKCEIKIIQNPPFLVHNTTI